MQHIIGNTAEQQPRQTAAAMRGHGDQVDVRVPRVLENAFSCTRALYGSNVHVRRDTTDAIGCPLVLSSA